MRSRALSALLSCLALAPLASAAPVASDVQQRVRASTFEVVMPKGAEGQLTYERPPRLELIPYSIRSDAYWPIGTAFAVGPNRFLTAGHVLTATIGNPSGRPALRDAAGHVYPIERVLGFSLDRDFALIAVGGAPAVEALPTSAKHDLDQGVLAVGNALGDGIVIRDGLLTSETPEEMEGRWKWLRFSAAASPGSSGGPLLDASGAVIGVITAKSPSENLNYALPIAEALQADPSVATLTARSTLPLPILPRDPAPLRLADRFALPCSFDEFGARFEQAMERADRAAMDDVLRRHQDSLFPRGKASRVLGRTSLEALPTLVSEGDEDQWDAPALEGVTQVELADDGLVQSWSTSGVQYFRIRRPGGDASDGFYADPKAFSDLLLKGVKVLRPLGSESVRITSLGPVSKDTTHEDRFGRRWQVRAWWLAELDSYLLVYCLPTPEGYVGFGERVVPGGLSRALALSGLVADFTLAHYRGTPAQWSAFLARTAQRPAPLADVRLSWSASRGMQFASSRIELDVPGDAFGLDERSIVEVAMGFPAGGPSSPSGRTLSVNGLYLVKSLADKSAILVLRRERPPKDAGPEELHRWDEFLRRSGEYDGVAHRNSTAGGYLIGTTIAPGVRGAVALDSQTTALYVIECLETESSLPRELEDRQRAVLRGLKLLEP